jgi:hypothetical protein
VQRNFNPCHRAARATGLTIPEGHSHLIKTRREWQRPTPFDETAVFGAYYFSRNLKFLLEAEEPSAIVESDSQHINYRLLFAD